MLKITTTNTESTETEVWVPVKRFTNYYEVSNRGRVRNMRGTILKTYTINSGYECLKFTVKGVRTSHLVHRLVAEAFCTPKDEAGEVNHIDGNKTNNRSSNLEWVTSSENKHHAFNMGLRTKESCISTLGKKHKSTSSKYHNVGYDKKRGKWLACVRHHGKNFYQKRFDTEKEAALHVNWILDELGLMDRPRNVV